MSKNFRASLGGKAGQVGEILLAVMVGREGTQMDGQPFPCRKILQPRFQLTDNRLHLLIGEGIVDALAVEAKDEPEIFLVDCP